MASLLTEKEMLENGDYAGCGVAADEYYYKDIDGKDTVASAVCDLQDEGLSLGGTAVGEPVGTHLRLQDLPYRSIQSNARFT